MVTDTKYADLLSSIMFNGTMREDRTGVGTLSSFGEKISFDLREGFPILSGKKIHWKSVVEELLWFISGDTQVKTLMAKGVRIWNEWQKSDGTIGPGYGAQWRSWVGSDGTVTDQLSNVVHDIKNNPTSRRLVVNAWNVGDLPKMALPPCHMFYQFYVDNEFLDMQMYQRSADMFLGVPFNIASYALLLSMVAKVTGLTPRNLTLVFGDAHVYLNHLKPAHEYLSRVDYIPAESKPVLALDNLDNLFEYTSENIHLKNYTPLPTIKATVAV